MKAARRLRFGLGPFLGRIALALLFSLGLAKGAASAQPFGQYLLFSGPALGYVEIPHSTDLNPTAAFTFEAWVKVSDAHGGGCSSIAGKNWQQAWWIGVCGTTLRSYIKGGSSQLNGGVIPPAQWTHIAVVFDGTSRVHYVNGENVAIRAETGPLTTSTDPMCIGSDAQWPYSPAGTIDEVRIWNVARTQDQIRAGLMRPIAAATAGLQAVWPLDFNAGDAVGSHDGTLTGTATYAFSGTGPSCTPGVSSTALCLLDRFLVTATFRTGDPGTPESPAQVVPTANFGSGLFWFFGPDNWEVLVKALNGCGIAPGRYWIFTAATTNVFYRLEVSDYPSGSQRVYFNYHGPPAPAVTDTNAFATCP